MNKRHFIKHASLGALGLTAPPLSSRPLASGPSQSLLVYQDEAAYVLIGNIDRKEITRHSSAANIIQTAVDRLPEGGHVQLESGTYWIDRQINLKSRVHLSGQGESSRLVFASSHDTGVALRVEEADRAVISQLAIFAYPKEGTGQTGIMLANCGDCHVTEVFVTGLAQHGIHLFDDCFLCSVKACKVAGGPGNGIFLQELYGGGRGGDYVPNLVADCTVYGTGKGIVLDKSIVINLTGCTVYQTTGHAYHLYNQSHSVSISGCRSYQIADDAVVLEQANEVNMAGNIFCWHEGHGIVLRGAAWGSITGNNVIDSGSYNVFDPDTVPLVLKDDERPFRATPTAKQRQNSKIGIYLAERVRGLTITGNAIFNWPVALKLRYGIREESGCFNNVIAANNLNYYSEGVVADGQGTQVSNNVGEGDQPYAGRVGTDLLQYFDPRLTERFIQNQMPTVR